MGGLAVGLARNAVGKDAILVRPPEVAPALAERLPALQAARQEIDRLAILDLREVRCGRHGGDAPALRRLLGYELAGGVQRANGQAHLVAIGAGQRHTAALAMLLAQRERAVGERRRLLRNGRTAAPQD